MNRALSAMVVGALVLAPSLAEAQDKASAEELFQLGKGAMARQELTKACNYFQASLNADFALGTLLNLAICHEQAGKVASAWSEYRTLEDRSRQATPPQLERAKFAHDHAEALRARLSRVRIVLSPDAKGTTGLVVKIDGVVAPPELFDAGIPVDLGKRTVTATAPQRDEWSQVVPVDDEKLKLDVAVPALKASAAKPAPPPPSTVVLADIDRIAAAKSQRTIGFIVGGVGVASLVAGGVFGLLAVGASGDAKCASPCFNGSPELANAHDAYRRANTFGWVSNIALGAGLVGLGAGTYLVLTAGSGADKKSARIGLSPNGLVFAGAL